MAVATLVGAAAWGLGAARADRQARVNSLHDARDLVERLRGSLANELREADVESMQSELSMFGGTRHVLFAGLVDGSGRIVAASEQGVAGQPASAVLPARTGRAWAVHLETIAWTMRAARAGVRPEPAGCRIHAYAALPPSAAFANGGFVYLLYDYANDCAAARRAAAGNAALLAALLAIAAAVLWWYLQQAVTARVQGLVAAVERFGRGERDVQIAPGGGDEIAGAGQALARMMASVTDAERQSREAQARYRALVEHLPGAAYIDSGERPGWTRYISPQIATLFGHDAATWIAGGPEYWLAHLHPEEREQVWQEWRRACETGDMFDREYRLLSPAGAQHWVHEIAGSGGFVESGEQLKFGVMLDVSERKRAEEALRASEHMLQTAQAVGHIGSWYAEPDLRGRLVCSEECARIFGLRAGQPGEPALRWLAGVHPGDREPLLAALAALLHNGAPVSARYRYRRPGGDERWIHSYAELAPGPGGGTPRLLGVAQDVTAQIEAERRIEHLAYHDVLTGLPNRALFSDRLGQALAQARRDGSLVVVLYVDLDNFKTINDTLGHPIGDRLLQVVAARLGDGLREGDTVCRHGGDEFLVLLPRVAHQGDAAEVATKLCRVLHEPMEVGGHRLQVTATIGVSVFPDDSGDEDTLVRHADIALYSAKAAGKNTWHFFNADMARGLQQHRQLENDLREALERGEFRLQYQPQIELASGRVVGVEALLRWRHPRRGEVPPAEFIPVAEHIHLILPLGEWVLATACAQLARWQADGLPPLRVSVNLSARQLQDAELPAKVRRVLGDTGIDPALVELEVTESAVMQSTGLALHALESLRAVGVSLAIDDFGTGYSSLGALKHYPFARLKIDRVFIRDLPDGSEEDAIVRAILAMARALRLAVIAEGVETQGQLDFLRRIGCDEVQGYLTGRPCEPEAIATRLARPPAPVPAAGHG